MLLLVVRTLCAGFGIFSGGGGIGRIATSTFAVAGTASGAGTNVDAGSRSRMRAFWRHSGFRRQLYEQFGGCNLFWPGHEIQPGLMAAAA